MDKLSLKNDQPIKCHGGAKQALICRPILQSSADAKMIGILSLAGPMVLPYNGRPLGRYSVRAWLMKMTVGHTDDTSYRLCEHCCQRGGSVTVTYSLKIVYPKARLNATQQPQGFSTKWKFLFTSSYSLHGWFSKSGTFLPKKKQRGKKRGMYKLWSSRSQGKCAYWLRTHRRLVHHGPIFTNQALKLPPPSPKVSRYRR